MPVWNEPFYYYDLTEPMLMSRVLEITVWDYDKYEANSFLGETLIDLSQTPLENQPFAYSLLDMDDENPLRLRLRQRRYSSQTPPARSRSQTSHYESHYPSPNMSRTTRQGMEGDDYFDCSYSLQNLPFYPEYNSRRSRPSDREGYRNVGGFSFHGVGDWNKNSGVGSGSSTPNAMKRNDVNLSGYLSDHSHAQCSQINSRPRRRPKSATALRNVIEIDDSDQSYTGQNSYLNEVDQQLPAYDRGRRAMCNDYSTAAAPLSNGRPRGRTRQEILQAREQSQSAGYGSDGGSETLSVNSAQSMNNRISHEQQMSVEDNDAGSGSSIRQHHQNTSEEYGMDESMPNIAGVPSGSNGGVTGGKGAQPSAAAAAALLAKQRKKSIMTRFIPGRNGSSESSKRMGFARSEEVGVPALSVPGEQSQTPNTFTKQASKESTDSSDNWLPILPDRPLGSFVENLGPGQVVGRQVLASPVMGEIMVKILFNASAGIVVEILETKNLVVRHGSKLSPAYLIEGKNCIAKAKTQTSRKSTSSIVQQTMVFNVFDTKKKMLQLSVLGDYGRMERKGFMGIAQINLDELDLSQQHVVGWYKLFHSNSLVSGGTGQSGQVVRKDSEISLNEMRQ